VNDRESDELVRALHEDFFEGRKKNFKTGVFTRRLEMKFSWIGYGKMGRLLETLLLERGHEITAIVDLFITLEKSHAGNRIYRSIEDPAVFANKPDIAIEVTHPEQAPANLLFLAGKKIPVVVGTTGWYERLPEIKDTFEKAGVSLFWAPNFSLGMNLFYRVVTCCSRAFDPFPEYDVGAMETHHNKKADSPSGTAKIIAEKILAGMTRKKKAVYEMLDRPPAADEIHFASLRAGSVPGVHSVVFDSPADTIEITHTLRNREGLALGAIRAAEWLHNRKESGVFTMDDMLTDILGETGE